MTHQYTRATFNTDGECLIVPMTEEEIKQYLSFMESMSASLSQSVVSEPLPDDEH